MWETLAGAALVGAAMGAAKNKEDQKNYKKAKKRQKVTTVYNHWTGLNAPEAKNPNPFWGDVLTGALAGAQMGANISSMKSDKPAPKSESSSDYSKDYSNLGTNVNPWTLYG